MHDKPRILVTRPEPDGADTAARLEGLGFAPVCHPLITMMPIRATLPPADQCAALILSSANALRALDGMEALAPYLHLPVFAVGDRTANHARAHGFQSVESADGAFLDLVDLITKKAPDGLLFYPTTARAAGDLASAMEPHGVKVTLTYVYDMVPCESLTSDVITDLKNGSFAAAIFYSPHTARTFCELTDGLLDRAAREHIEMLCLSENVAAPLLDHHFTRIGLADHPSEEAMMALALSFARNQIG